MAERDEAGRFLTGTRGGPGRQTGSKNKLTERFWVDLYGVWQEMGEAAVKTMAKKDPAGFVRVVASVMPKEAELTVKRSSMAELSDDELAAIIREGQEFFRSLNGGNTPPPDPKLIN
jgi:hypothetical protein